MRVLKLLALLVAIVGVSVAGQASATPLSSGTLATLPAPAVGALVEKAQFYPYRRVYYRPRTYYRPVYYAPRFVYRPVYAYRPVYRRSRIVCRIRYGYYGPRRVCVRRYY